MFFKQLAFEVKYLLLTVLTNYTYQFCYRPTEGDAHVRLTMILFLVQLAEKSRHDSELGWVTQAFLPHLIQLLLQEVKKVCRPN